MLAEWLVGRMPECRSLFDTALGLRASIAVCTIHINDVARARRGALAGSLHAESANTDVAFGPVEMFLTMKNRCGA